MGLETKARRLCRPWVPPTGQFISSIPSLKSQSVGQGSEKRGGERPYQSSSWPPLYPGSHGEDLGGWQGGRRRASSPTNVPEALGKEGGGLSQASPLVGGWPCTWWKEAQPRRPHPQFPAFPATIPPLPHRYSSSHVLPSLSVLEENVR